MSTMHKAAGYLAVAAACLAVSEGASATEYTSRFLFSENVCPACASPYGEYRTVELLSDNMLVTGRDVTTGKSPSGHAMLWDASIPGNVTVKWTEPVKYMTPEGVYDYYLPGGPYMGGRISDINASGAFLDGQHLEPAGVKLDDRLISPKALNDNGLVVGMGSDWGNDGQGHWMDVKSGTNGAFQIQGANVIRPVEVNNSGVIVGSGTANGQDQAFVFDLRSGSGRLVFDPTAVRSSTFSDVNNKGVALGRRTMMDGTSVAFLYDTTSAQITDLQIANPSEGRLNDLGQIVMGSQFFDGANWLDLNVVTTFGSDVKAFDINNHGDILLGRGTTNYRDFYITSAVPEPSAQALMALGCLGLVGAGMRRRARS